ncbi:MAG: glycosyl transferase, group 1 [Rhizobacter sp.]|nr:glycosyl transferase, group 1 [Rhizobacter sp.]
MRFLFVHQNFPGQYVHLATHLANIPGNEVVCISQRRGPALKGIRKIHYQPRREITKGIHHYLQTTEAAIVNAQEVARCAAQLKREGFKPDLMIGHNGWGEIWYLKDIFPRSPLLGYFEFFYRFHGADTGFDKNDTITADTAPRIRTRNTGNLIGLEAVDWGQCPTLWQRSVYPLRAQSMLSVIHDGIDTRS